MPKFKRKKGLLLKIEMLSVNQLVPYTKNARHNEKAVDKVASSIKEFGFKNPIIIDANNEIIAGHTRLMAAKKLGIDEVPTIKVDDLSPEQVKAFRIADNKTSEYAEWDFECLL
jgi:ParB/RepB/Spo0J family partition protein